MTGHPRHDGRSARLNQPDLFAEREAGPEGFRYRADLLEAAEAALLAQRLADLPFQPFDFHGHLANRQVVGFGLRYDYATRQVKAAPPIPDWLMGLREKAAFFADRPAEAFVQVLINAYPPGSGIGWHKDKPHFEEVVGVSLGAPCTLRFRLKKGEGWERQSLLVEPRSAYLLSGPARWLWEHSIPPLQAHRHSITFRTLASDR